MVTGACFIYAHGLYWGDYNGLYICNPIAKEKCTIDTILRCPHLNMLSINPNTKQITFSFDNYGGVLDIFFILNSKSLRIVNTNVLDWNAIVEIGIYSGNNAQNMPINHNDVWINAIVLAANGNQKFLSLFAFSAKGMFIRQMDNTRWTEWVQIK